MRHARAWTTLLLAVLCPAWGGCGGAATPAGPRVFERPLWPDGPPTGNGLRGPEELGACIGNISTATLTVYLPDPEVATGAALVLLPGGGYGVLCVEREGWDMSRVLNGMGIAAIVLKYRLPNGHPLVPGDDARRALRTVRARAGDWGIDPGRVGVWGFSAGGHLAATVACRNDAGRPDATDPVERSSCRPDLVLLFYPVVSMRDGVTHEFSRERLLGPGAAAALVEAFSIETRAGPDFPPTYLMHSRNDRIVAIENSRLLKSRLEGQGVPVELVEVERGGHGTRVMQVNPDWQVPLRRFLEAWGWL